MSILSIEPLVDKIVIEKLFIEQGGKKMKFKIYQKKKTFIQGKTIIGIDPGKNNHQASIINEHGFQQGKSFFFKVSYESFHESLWNKITSFIPDPTPSKVVFAVETSSNLWNTIAHYLNEKGYTVLLINPLTTYHSRPLMSHDFSKTDPKDAFLVAKNAFEGNYNFYQNFPPEVNELHQLSIAYDKLLKDRNRNILRMRSLMDTIFPEYVRFLNLDTKTSVYLLKSNFLPYHFINLDSEKEAPIVAKISNNNYGKQLLVNLKDAAFKTIGVNKEAEEQSLRAILDSWLMEYEKINEQLKIISYHMITMAKKSEYFCILTSLKGISDKLAALFIAECRELDKFTNYKQIEKMAGLNLRQNQSGNYTGPRHISHIGNKRLLWIIYQMTVETALYIPEVRIKFLKGQLKKKKYRKNIIAASSQLLKLIMALIKEKREYEIKEEKVKELKPLEEKYKKLNKKAA
jgi:transposase